MDFAFSKPLFPYLVSIWKKWVRGTYKMQGQWGRWWKVWGWLEEPEPLWQGTTPWVSGGAIPGQVCAVVGSSLHVLWAVEGCLPP